MQRYILLRIIQAIITSLLVATLIFLLIRLAGNPLTWMINPKLPEEARILVAQHYGLDKPTIVQYGYFLASIFQADFGTSFVYSRPALHLILERVPATLELAGTALIFALIIALPTGVYGAVKRGRFADVAVRVFAYLGVSAPSFWLALMGIYLFAVKAGILPVGGRGDIKSLIMPVLILSWALAAGLARLARSGMIDVLNADYITLARAKGVHEQLIIWKHAFKNAAIPVVTMAMLLMIIVLSGDVVLENIFAWPGLGRLIMTSVLARDYPVVQAFSILVSFAFIMVSLLADIIYAYLNPKIRY